MKTININITSWCIHIIVFFILFAIAYWYVTLEEGAKHRRMYRVANILWSSIVSMFFILLAKGLYHIFTNTHFIFTL